MAVRIVLTNKSQPTLGLVEASTTSHNDVQMNRLVYQQLRSLAKNKTISSDYDNGLLPKAFINLVEEFEKKHQGESVDDSINKLDEYLGSLGLTEEYPFSKDRVNIAQWATSGGGSSTRNVISAADSGDNVIITVDGIDYNVVHNS